MNQFNFSVSKVMTKKPKPSNDQLEFGRYFTDHMFIMDYHHEKGWYDGQIVPYQPITLDPASMIFHYGQTVFEGLKAYKTANNDIHLFRPEENIKRLNFSNERLCIPKIDPELALSAIKELVALEKDWIPNAVGTSLYIRPFIIATEPFLGVSTAKQYKFIVILSPVGAYYKSGINPIKIAVEREYVRAVKGGTGEVKTAGNYASSLIAQEKATQNGYAQVLWLDAIEKKYIEEVGSMNVFFKIDGEVITPELNGSILPGVTRKSAIQLLKHWGIPIVERKISLDEIEQAHEEGRLEEAFGTGTAAVISPIGELKCNGNKLLINNEKTGEIAKRLYDSMTGIQYGELEDTFDWINKLDLV